MLGAHERRVLLEIARRSVHTAVVGDGAYEVDLVTVSVALRTNRASFVTIKQRRTLRGCIGTLEAYQALAADVAANAYRAATADFRFLPVDEAELGELSLEVSVLSDIEDLEVGSLEELLDRLRPGIDGLVLTEGERKATFLPAVWEQLPEPEEFVDHLYRKAMLTPGHWSAATRVARYTTEEFRD